MAWFCPLCSYAKWLPCPSINFMDFKAKFYFMNIQIFLILYNEFLRKKIGHGKVLVVLIVELTQTHYHREKLLHHENCLPLCHRIVGCGMFIWYFWVVGVPLNIPKIASVWNTFFQSRLLAIPLCIWKLK